MVGVDLFVRARGRLTPKGKEEAMALAEDLKSVGFDEFDVRRVLLACTALLPWCPARELAPALPSASRAVSWPRSRFPCLLYSW